MLPSLFVISSSESKFAPGPGRLDWANQPNPFRNYPSSVRFRLPLPVPTAALPSAFPFDAVGLQSSDVASQRQPAAFGLDFLSSFFYHSFAVSAAKQPRGTTGVEHRYYLRVNPSSGNLHPTEVFLAAPSFAGGHTSPALYHYDCHRHSLSLRREFSVAEWTALCGSLSSTPPSASSSAATSALAASSPTAAAAAASTTTAHSSSVPPPVTPFFVALTSIYWREAWKYGVRAYRYCMLDIGHALGSLSASCDMHGYTSTPLTALSSSDLTALLLTPSDLSLENPEAEIPQVFAAITPQIAAQFCAPHQFSLPASLLTAPSAKAPAPTTLSLHHIHYELIASANAAVTQASPSTGEIVISFTSPSSLVIITNQLLYVYGRSSDDKRTKNKK